MNTQDLQTGLSLIRKDFNLDEQELRIEAHEITERSVLAKLTYIVAYLMEKDFPRLLQVLYRIDVSEQKLKETLAGTDTNTAEIIAQMIFEREMQKVEIRKKYSL